MGGDEGIGATEKDQEGPQSHPVLDLLAAGLHESALAVEGLVLIEERADAVRGGPRRQQRLGPPLLR